jgi:hypothetical protein
MVCYTKCDSFEPRIGTRLCVWRRPVDNPRPTIVPAGHRISLTADNYGKSPATLIGYACEVCERNALPRKPNYHRVSLRNTIKPHQTGLAITTRLFGSPFVNPVAYGRIWYRDIWRKKHYFSFILTTDATDHSSVSGVHRAYSDWT